MIPDGVLLNGQGSCEVSDVRLGLKPMSYNGCGVIALYNAMVLSGRRADLRLIHSAVGRNALTLFGLLGVSPFRYAWAAAKAGIRVHSIRRYHEFALRLKGHIGIVCCWTGKPFLSTMHFMAVDGRNTDRLDVCNRYNDLKSTSAVKDLTALCSKRQYVMGYILE